MSLQVFESAVSALARIYRNDLYKFAKHCLGFTQITAHTHGPLIQELASPSRRKLICMPRGTFKSSIASVAYPIWLLINNPDLRIAIDSQVYKNSTKFLREIKTHLESPKMTQLFGSFVNAACWNEGEIIINQRTAIKKEPSIFAMGVETSKVGMHADVIICDDLNSDKNSLTADGCQKIIDHYRMLTSILEPQGTLIVIGTRYAQNDLIGHILEAELERCPLTGKCRDLTRSVPSGSL